MSKLFLHCVLLRYLGLLALLFLVACSSSDVPVDSLARRPVNWTSPTCDELDKLNNYAQGFSVITEARLLLRTNVARAHAAGLGGQDVIVVGVDTADDNGDIFDCTATSFQEGHGVHVRDLVKLVAPKVTYISIKACEAVGRCQTRYITSALRTLEDELEAGIKVVANLSIVTSTADLPSRELFGLLADYQDTFPNFLAVASGGNNGLSDDPLIAKTKVYPASFSDRESSPAGYYPLSNIMSIGTVGIISNTLQLSQTNPRDVKFDLVAPAVRLCLSAGAGMCRPTGDTTGLTGASFATAVVSGVAALWWEKCPNLNAQRLRQLLRDRGRLLSGTLFKLVNANPNFTCPGSPGVAPSIRSLTATPSTTIYEGQSVTLAWQVQGTAPITFSILPSGGTITGNSVTLTPATTTTYELEAKNEFGSAFAPLTVTVLPLDLAFKRNQRLGKTINIGSALEADPEGAWGVAIKQEFFKTIKDAGFSSVRIPITWSSRALVEAPYTITPSFLVRVDEIIAQATAQGLNVVINMHFYDALHDNPDGEHERWLALWRQIAEHYQTYSNDQLYFELLHQYYYPNDQLRFGKWNDFLADAINTIRQSNPQRTLIVGGDQGSYLGIAQLVLPENDRNLIVNFNYYDPYAFTHQAAGQNIPWGTAEEQYTIESNFDIVNSWAQSHNRPIFLSEFGVIKNADNVSRVSYTQFVRSKAEERGFSWGYWDFGSSNDGIYNRVTLAWNTDMLKALIP